MAKASPFQGNFSGGEISPLMHGNVRNERYSQSLIKCLNYVPTIQGGLTRRPGTFFIEEIKDSAKKARLVPFKFSATDAVQIEFGHNYIRFFKNYAPILNSVGAPYEIVTEYPEDQIFELTYNQSADVLYICHPNHIPRKLSRYADNQWLYEEVSRTLLPYEYDPVRVTTGATATATATFDAGATTGTQTITVSTGSIADINAMVNRAGEMEIQLLGGHKAPYNSLTKLRIATVFGAVYANGDWNVEYLGSGNFRLIGSTYVAGYNPGTSDTFAYNQIFSATDVGRYLSLGTTNVPVRITAVTNSITATATILGTLSGTSGLIGHWGLWHGTNGPAASCFFEDRLFFVGTPSAPQRIDGSQTGDYENFAKLNSGGTITSECAVSFVLNSNDVNIGKWLFSDEKGLLIGTLANEWVVKSASSQEAISPTSISAKQTSSVGSSECYPVQVQKAILFIQKSGRKLREFHYFYDVDGFRATDLSVLAEHITLSGVKELAFQKDPLSIIWAVRNDGQLIALTYDRDVDNLRAGWHRHELGGNVKVESVSVIPSPDGKTDDLWMITRRYINGAYVRYIEVLGDFFEDDKELKDAYFLDCGLTYDDKKQVDSVMALNPLKLEVTFHGFSDGDTVLISDMEGLDEAQEQVYTVDNATTNNFELNLADASAFTPYISGGYVRKRITGISGLDHLEGETVSILGDGAVQSTKVVAGGAITLSIPAGLVQIGLNYYSDAQLPRIDAGAADGTAIGKTRRTNKVALMLHRSVNLLLGPTFEKLSQIIFRKANEPLGQAVSLYSGIQLENFEADYDFENNICWRQDQPLPSTILAVMPQMTTQDR